MRGMAGPVGMPLALPLSEWPGPTGRNRAQGMPGKMCAPLSLRAPCAWNAASVVP
jgi:hypothetical protein